MLLSKATVAQQKRKKKLHWNNITNYTEKRETTMQLTLNIFLYRTNQKTVQLFYNQITLPIEKKIK